MFCDKEGKYKKGNRSKEPLLQGFHLNTDNKLCENAIEIQDIKIIAVTSRDIVAAKACYHVTSNTLEKDQIKFKMMMNILQQLVC